MTTIRIEPDVFNIDAPCIVAAEQSALDF